MTIDAATHIPKGAGGALDHFGRTALRHSIHA